MNKSKSLLVITNLYPVPWAPNRASFNKQQFDLIAESMPVNIIVLVAWKEWLSNRVDCKSTEKIKYCPYFYLPKFARRLVPIFQFISLFFCLPWIRKKQPRAVLASWGFPDAVAVAMLNSILKLPFFVKVHGTDVNENSRYHARGKLMKKWLNKAATIFCASQALAESLAKVGVEKKRLKVNYNGVNPSIFYPVKKSCQSKYFVFVGSLIKTKGCNELLAAFIALLKTQPECKLDIIGEGPLRQLLEEEIGKNNVNKSVRLLGSLPLVEVAAAIREANVLVLPSYREGVPNVLLESFASGTPVIATEVGGIPEVINSDVGLTIPVKNEQALTSAMESALAKVWSTEEILTHASQFDWQKNVSFVLKELGDE